MNRSLLLPFILLLFVSQVALTAQEQKSSGKSSVGPSTIITLNSKQEAQLATSHEINLTWHQSNQLKKASKVRVYKVYLIDAADLAQATEMTAFNVCIRRSEKEIEIPHKFLVPPAKAKWREEQLENL